LLIVRVMHPLIGITGCREQNRHGQPVTLLAEAYARAVTGAGGIPLLILPGIGQQLLRSILSSLGGLLFSGGGDIEPQRYQSTYRGRLVDVDPERDALELDLVQMAVTAGKPFLGICRGCQVVNVALGGTLHPDLRSAPNSPLRHEFGPAERRVRAHDVAIMPKTVLADIIEAKSIGVNSHHHQGLDGVSSRVSVSALAPDGLVEGIEVLEHPFGIAVQWHPEWLIEDSWTQRLFRRFVEAAGSE
jgi:putative glutamine amidotransferase